MRILLLYIFFLLGSFSTLFGQNNSAILDQCEVFPISNLAARDTSFMDLQFLKDKLKDKRIVMLGEQSHGDGATFEAKVKLIKFLHQELGFDLLCFESGLYDNYYAYNTIQDQDYFNSPIKESVFAFWSETKEFKPLIQYIHAQKNLASPLILAGFDCQEDFYFKENYFNDLKANLATTWNLTEDEAMLIEQTFSSDGEDLHNNPSDSTMFFSACKKVIKAIDKLESSKQIKLSILKQTLISWLGYLNYTLDEQNGKTDIVQNRRDQLMANNVMALAKLYPDKKIICWGASYHFANEIEQVKITPLSLEKLKNMGDGDTVGQDVDHYYRDAVPMGKILKKEFGNSLYSIAFSSYEGKFGMLGGEEYDFAQVQAPPESVENELVNKNISIAFVEFSKFAKNAKPFYLSALGNIPLQANWNLVFDANIFIKTSYIPQLDEQAIHKSSTEELIILDEKPTTENKKLVDYKTKKPLDYAKAVILNRNISATSNSKGQFYLDVTTCKANERIILSNMGYLSDTIDVQTYLKKNTFQLKPCLQNLHGVRIVASKLSAKEIVMRAEQLIRSNYMQLPYTQNFIYRYMTMEEDTLTFKKETSISILNEQGIKSGKVARTELKKINERIQRPTNKMNNGWGEYNLNAKLFNSNVITLKSNPLHRCKFYKYTNNGILKFEDRDVYEIEFECIKPTNTAIGMGRNPLASSGTLYIDVENYAILKFEQEVVCSPRPIGEKSSQMLFEHVHHIVQTFAAFQGKYFPSYFSNIQIHKTINETSHKITRGFHSTEYSSMGVYSSVDTSNHEVLNDKEFDNQCNTLVSEKVSTLYQFLNTPFNLQSQSNVR